MAATNSSILTTESEPSSSSSGSTSTSSSAALFSFGIVTDIQFCDCDDGFSFGGTPRYYRHAISAAAVCSSLFEARRVDFALNLGDMIDGLCKNSSSSSSALDLVKAALSRYSGRWYSVYGNHELYNFTRSQMKSVLDIPFFDENKDPSKDPALVAYYSFKPHPKFKVIILDSYDVSVLDRATGSDKFKVAETFMLRNPNYKVGNGNSPVGLVGLEQRFVEFNGGFGENQLAFLAEELASSSLLGEKVLICAHHPFHPRTASDICLPWNFDSVLSVLQRFGSDVVVATLSGHTHDSGYWCEEGVHHVVLEAVIESLEDTFALATVYNDRIEVTGFGEAVSLTLPF